MAKNNTPAQQQNGMKLWLGNTREYFASVWSELKKVHWPDRRQLTAYTGVVLFTVALVALIIWLFDKGLSFLLTALMKAFA
ncbi:Preprotein translocase subunit SecE [Syntrophomonas zehnderi OL-4]|uniref:Protein translocase subunit SecE n=2 Tax=Syntrophomonas TaxID=862 RepID=A0A0E3W310_9FIRM|nr:Preprotein translocase subunit SecE [Syntrophomonas zehnderi OL-4]